MVLEQALIGYEIRKKLINSLNEEQVLQIFKGVLEGFLSGSSFDAILPCLDDVQQEGELVVQAVEEFMKEDTKSVTNGLKLLG